jgi:hypothetical protein
MAPLTKGARRQVQKEQPAAGAQDVQGTRRAPTQHQDCENGDGTVAEKWSEAGGERLLPAAGHDSGHQERLERSRLNRRRERQAATEEQVPEQFGHSQINPRRDRVWTVARFRPYWVSWPFGTQAAVSNSGLRRTSPSFATQRNTRNTM